LLTPCEVAVKTVAPAIRAKLAQTLTQQHELNQIEVAKILGITQSAVSKYNKKVRGTTIPLDGMPEVQTITNQIASILLTKPARQMEIMKLFCQACTIIRSKGLMCELCQQNQTPKIDECSFCGITST
jgi:predicted transcriptional regulator